MQSSICVCMIVKNEAAIIERCLASLRDTIDYWVIIDTGSDDDTKQRIEAALDGIPGELIDRPWVNFGHNRSELVTLAKGKADYLLLIDADMVVHTSDKFTKSFDADAYFIRSVGDLEYERHLLVRGSLDWKYEGATHEYIDCDQIQSSKHLETLWITHHADGGTRPEKFQRDVQLLTESLAEDPTNARSVFYLAQTYRDMADAATALIYYKKRTKMAGWDEEVWYSMFQVGLLYQRLGMWPEALHWLLEAYQSRPWRAEPLHAVSTYYRQRGEYQLGYLFAKTASEIPYPTDILFIQRNVYEYMVFDELSICAYYLGKYDESAQLCEWLLSKATIPPEDRERIEKNKELSVAADRAESFV